MGMEYKVYVGPYLKISPKNKKIDLYELVGDSLSNFRREFSLDKYIFATPNRSVYGINRTIYWNKHTFNIENVYGTDVERELLCFNEEFKEEIDKIKEYSPCSVLWGIVSSFS